MRPYHIFIVVYVLLTFLWAGSSRPAERPIPPQLVIPDEPPKLYHPRDGKETWTHMVNHLMTRAKWEDEYGSVIYHQGFSYDDNRSATQSYNHTNGALSLTVVELSSEKISVKGINEKLTVHKSREVKVLTLISINYDTMPDLAIMQQVNLTESGDKQIGTSVLFEAVPQGRTSPRTHPNKWKKQFNYAGTWAFWEVFIMEALGFEAIIPEPKEKM